MSTGDLSQALRGPDPPSPSLGTPAVDPLKEWNITSNEVSDHQLLTG